MGPFLLVVVSSMLVSYYSALGQKKRLFCPEHADIPDSACHSSVFTYTCIGSCGELRLGEQLCACDSECVTYGDCCPDFFEECPGVVDEELFKGPINAGNCVKTNYPDFSRSTNLIGSCHPAWQDDITEDLCQNRSGVIRSLPAQGKEDNKPYANLYCAKCNFQDFDLWQMKFQCSRPLPTFFTIEMLHESYLCDPFYRPPHVTANMSTQLRSCKILNEWNPIIASCDERCENQELIEGCQTPVTEHVRMHERQGEFAGYRYFKNKYCAWCNGALKTNKFECGRFEQRDPSGAGDYSFVLLTDFDHSGCLKTTYRRGDGQNGQIETFCDELMHGRKMPFQTGNMSSGNGSLWNGTMDEVMDGSRKYSEWLGILSLVCVSLSVLCLVLRLLLQSCVLSFHNLAGWNQFCLCLVILMALLSFLIGPWAVPVRQLCTAVGMLMHWAFLASFFWMNVIAIDMWLVFRPDSFYQVRPGNWQKKAFIRYALYACIVPSVIVLSAFCLDLLEMDSTVRPFYGVGICWIAQQNSLILFFGVPLGLLLLINSLFFVLTARGLFITLRSSSDLSHSGASKSYLQVYLKLFVLMGVTWGLAFVATLLKYDIVWGIYTVLNASQGMFISVSSLWSHRVYKDIFGTEYAGTSIERPNQLQAVCEDMNVQPRNGKQNVEHELRSEDSEVTKSETVDLGLEMTFK